MLLDHNTRPALHVSSGIDRNAAREMTSRFGSLQLSARKRDSVFWYRWAMRPGDYELQIGNLQKREGPREYEAPIKQNPPSGRAYGEDMCAASKRRGFPG
jgi:hypothetical protein